MPAISPFLWFDTQAEEAARFYTSVFPNSSILEISRYPESGPGEPGAVMVVRFSLDGHEFLALNGGPDHYHFDESISFVVPCSSADEVDYYWERLTEGGEEGNCGWLKDRFGLSWQIVPEALSTLLGDPEPGRAGRAMTAMLGMRKIDIDAMARAAEGDPAPG
jgi:predicted 3-demethylubiquinone-9 3-methyltransferase (glyoxalase superfamily)